MQTFKLLVKVSPSGYQWLTCTMHHVIDLIFFGFLKYTVYIIPVAEPRLTMRNKQLQEPFGLSFPLAWLNVHTLTEFRQHTISQINDTGPRPRAFTFRSDADSSADYKGHVAHTVSHTLLTFIATSALPFVSCFLFQLTK